MEDVLYTESHLAILTDYIKTQHHLICTDYVSLQFIELLLPHLKQYSAVIRSGTMNLVVHHSAAKTVNVTENKTHSRTIWGVIITLSHGELRIFQEVS